MSRFRLIWLAAAAAILVVLAAAGCGGSGGNDPGKPVALSGTCTGCHTDAEMLQATALPDPPPAEGDAGEG